MPRRAQHVRYLLADRIRLDGARFRDTPPDGQGLSDGTMGDVAEQHELQERRRRFEELAMPAVNALYRQAMKLTNDPDDAQDLVQDTFERGFKAFDRFEPGSIFEA
ncbi:MAG: hypothetical protein L0J71_02290, partial [Bifidobacterium crudilactis]|nr:hypothetical protein [Bifidobacterium crudilactis]